MGAAHSRARPGAGPAAKIRHHLIPGGSNGSGNKRFDGVAAANKENHFGYFIFCIKGSDRIKVVNASSPVLKMITAVIKRHFSVAKAGWDRHLAYSFKLQKMPGANSKTPSPRARQKIPFGILYPPPPPSPMYGYSCLSPLCFFIDNSL